MDEWQTDGACRGTDPEAMFVTGAEQHKAAKVCEPCPVRAACLAHALDNREDYGVWGGQTERQRRQLLKDHPHVTSWRAVLVDRAHRAD